MITAPERPDAGPPRAKGERRSISEGDYADLVAATHNQLHLPVILCWRNLYMHVSAVMREFTRAHPDWLTVIQLPAYALASPRSQSRWDV